MVNYRPIVWCWTQFKGIKIPQIVCFIVTAVLLIALSGIASVNLVNAESHSFPIPPELNNAVRTSSLGERAGLWPQKSESSLVDDDLQPEWQVDINFGIGAEPAIGADGTIYVATLDGMLALNTDGSRRWTFPWASNAAPAVAPDGTIYFSASYGVVYAINPDSAEKWRFEVGDDIRSSAAIVDDGSIVVGSFDSFLYVLNPDGSLNWRYEADEGIFSSPVISSSGVIYFGTYGASVTAL